MILLDTYEITKKIYVDYQNSIYFKAIDKFNSIPVIIKTILNRSFKVDAKNWFENEHQILQKNNLSGIIKPYKLETDKNSFFLILEDFQGQFLEQYLKQKHFETNIFFTIAIALLETLRKLHQNQIIHQNLNASSIIINPETYEPKITNFSFSTKFATENQTSLPQLEALNIAYISPEQTGRTSHPLDRRTDFYSLGVIFYQMLTGKIPCDYDGRNTLELIHYHLAQNPIPPHQIEKKVPQTVSSIVMKLLAKNPSDRYQSASAIKADLENCLNQYQTSGKIVPFELGTLDRRSHFVISPKLYGRALAIGSITSSMKRVCSGATEIVLISGQLGIGKTSSIERVVRPIAKKKGFFLRGKFDPSTVKTPYAGIKQAFGSLIQHLLTEDEDNLEVWREKIRSAVGKNGKVIVDILPELQLIIGSQPNILRLPAKETENRFNTVFVEFVRTFLSEKHPLVLCLDDLQWADSASLNLLKLILNSLDLHHLLIVLAYQNTTEYPFSLTATEQKTKTNYLSSAENIVFSDVIDFTDLLVHIIDELKDKVLVNQIALQELSLNDINQLLADTLHCSETKTLSLARLILKRTGGNPFSVKQLLQTLYEKELFSFDFQSFTWQWKLEEIRALPESEYKVLELVKKNLGKLNAESQQTIKIAACIGNQFDLETLAHICHQSKEQIAHKLQPALKARILLVVKKQPNSVYKFIHNRVQQTAYSLLQETQKTQIHLKIGRLLLQKSSQRTIESNIFNLVNHFNIGRKLISQVSLKKRVAELNLIAGQRAKAAIAYEIAANHFSIALELLPSSTWKENYDLVFKVYTEAIEVQYLLTNYQLAEHLANIALSLAKTVIEKIEIYKIKIHSCIASSRMELAINTGYAALKSLDMPISDEPTQNGDLLELLTQDEDLTQHLECLPKMSDPIVIAAMEILGIIIPAIYIVKPQKFSLTVLKMIVLSQQYGNSRQSAIAYGLSGLMLCASGNIDTGYKFGKLSLKIQKQFDDREIKSKVDFIYNNTIRHWREPVVNTISHILLGIREALEVGNIEDACFHAKYYCTYLFFIGEPLSSAKNKCQEKIEIIQNLKQNFQLNYARIWQQLNCNLQGLTSSQLLLTGEHFDEFQMIPIWQETNNATSLLALFLAKLILCYFLGDYQQAIENANRGKQYLEAAVGTMCFTIYHFYASLAKLALYSPQAELKSEYLQEILTVQKQLKKWASYAPDNYLNKYHLVTAEIARVLGKNELAAENYDLAITLAVKGGYIHETSLAEELTAKFYLSRNRIKVAKYYLTDAYHGYLRWGALAKIRALKFEYPQLSSLSSPISLQELTTFVSHNKAPEVSSQNQSPAKLDLLSVIKASQAISSEIILENLLSKMMEIVMENAGAQKAILLLPENSSWIVAASATIIPKTKVMLPQILLEEYQKLPKSIVNYVQNTHNTVILEQASKEGLFIEDPYIRENKSKSILAYPMIYKDELRGIVYLENKLITKAFTLEKLEVLQVLLSQVTISIENARLYKNLENHASVQKSLKQKETLLKEIHHRVKNNLFVVSSLLDFQSNYTEDPEVIKLLENCQNRIMSMALVHQHLYGNSELNKINFADYIDSLLSNLAYSQASEERNINLICNLDPIELNIETANPCGLIVNELVSNALEHGFRDRKYGNIWLSLQQNSQKQINLTIRDDGVGFKDGLDLYNSNSLGLELVCTLVEQINGEIKLDKSHGTKIEIIFEELDYQNRIQV